METQSEKQQTICYDHGQSCANCSNDGKLMCRFDIKDTILFVWPFVVMLGMLTWGIIRSMKLQTLMIWGLVGFLVIYIGYMIFFFNFWESKMLCSHCPFYVIDDDKTLKCYANYGIFKSAPYNPTPITKSEQIQFAIGASLLFLIPIIFLVIVGEYLFSVLSIGIFAIWYFSMQHNGCKKCPNFSCLLNRVPKERVDEYLRRNPTMREAWEKTGYKLTEK